MPALALDPVKEPAAAVLQATLSLPDASFVIFRHGILAEFRTDQLRTGLCLYTHGAHRGWQVGASNEHHFHPDLAGVRQVLFDAEPVPCQGGRLNYTVWFIGVGDCGNPHRPDGLFSVTLNRPYDATGQPRADILDAVYALYERIRPWPLVGASAPFLASYRRARSLAPVTNNGVPS